MGIIDEIGDNCYAAASEQAWKTLSEHTAASDKHDKIKEKDAANPSLTKHTVKSMANGATKLNSKNRRMPNVPLKACDKSKEKEF